MLRRTFLTTPLFAAGADDTPRVDYHAHPEGGMTVEKALAISRDRNVKLGLVEHAGAKESATSHRLSTDDELRAWIAALKGKPVYCGIQAEGMDWHRHFSESVIAHLDYVLGDALTMPDRSGKLIKLWTPAFQTNNPQDFMDRYVDYHVEVMARQPLDILANPTFLPEAIRSDAKRLWTEPRMRRIIDAAKKYHIAIEINTKYQVPAMPFLEMAKDAGLEFSFGSNAHDAAAIGEISFCVETWKKLRIPATRFFRPAAAGRKPIQLRTLA
ncbi:MAG: hypothetical protein JNL62_07640 [Bryobacterales bacterium]|nr:hypothetical protein [Bryobacterales bacterium]